MTAWEKKNGIKEKQKFIDLQENDEITDKNAYLLRRFIEAKWDEVTACYKEQQLAAETYYREILQGCKHVAAVDIGWAGSGAIALSHAVQISGQAESSGMEIFFAGFIRSYIRMTEPYMFTGPARLLQN